MSTLKRLGLILIAALLVVGLTTAGMSLSSASSATAAHTQPFDGRPAGGGSGLMELLKNLLVTSLIAAVVAGLSLGIDKLSARAWLRSARLARRHPTP